ncbi:MAG TPA: hypothetical protein VKU92_11460 [Acidimicrobiales bacterium]|nr:hypothetical protein [Acidimicrobiales bacterium]
MRTTLTLDPDTEELVRRRMRERGGSFKQVVNEAIRAGLGSAPAPLRRTTAYDLGAPQVNLDRALSLADEIEDEELVRKRRAGK